MLPVLPQVLHAADDQAAHLTYRACLWCQAVLPSQCFSALEAVAALCILMVVFVLVCCKMLPLHHLLGCDCVSSLGGSSPVASADSADMCHKSWRLFLL